MGWRKKQEEGKKGRSRNRVLAAQYSFQCCDDVWFCVESPPWLVLVKDHLSLCFQIHRPVQTWWTNLSPYFLQSLSSFHSHGELVWFSHGSLAGPTHWALDNKKKNRGFDLEWPPPQPTLSLPWSPNHLLLLGSQVPDNVSFLFSTLLWFCALVFPLAFVSWHPFSSFHCAYSWPQKCSLLAALAPILASWRKGRRRYPCLIPTACLGANSAQRATWPFSERLKAWRGRVECSVVGPAEIFLFRIRATLLIAPAVWPQSRVY